MRQIPIVHPVSLDDINVCNLDSVGHGIARWLDQALRLAIPYQNMTAEAGTSFCAW